MRSALLAHGKNCPLRTPVVAFWADAVVGRIRRRVLMVQVDSYLKGSASPLHLSEAKANRKCVPRKQVGTPFKG